MGLKVKIYSENCLDTMRRMGDSIIDTIITDPPYGLRFMGKKWDYDVPGIDIWQECLRVLKPGGTALIFAGSRTQHRMAVNIEDAGFILKDCIMWVYGSGFPKAMDISKQLDKGMEREVVGKSPNTRNRTKHNATTIITGQNIEGWNTTIPATPEAQLWNGWKSHGLKPAYEPILVCMKANDGTYAENALKWGVSGLNIDGGRVGIDDKDPNYRLNAKNHKKVKRNVIYGNRNTSAKVATQNKGYHNSQGRYPANIIFDGNVTNAEWLRYFYCAKASKAERNAGLNGRVKNVSHDGRDKHIENPYQRHENKQINCHSTVKPLKLMEYLCTLTKTPTGGIVFDPFMGSGTTGIACINTKREFIGSEVDEGYYNIADKRINSSNIGIE